MGQKFLMLTVMLALMVFPAFAGNMTLDGLTGGMSTDASDLIEEILFYILVISLAISVIMGILGVILHDSRKTKNGVTGIIIIIGITILYFAAMYGIPYLQDKYG